MAHRKSESEGAKPTPTYDDEQMNAVIERQTKHTEDAELLDRLSKLAEEPDVVLEASEEKFLNDACDRVFGQPLSVRQRAYARRLLEQIK